MDYLIYFKIVRTWFRNSTGFHFIYNSEHFGLSLSLGLAVGAGLEVEAGEIATKY